ncbi:MAG: hypothetical protein Q7T35_00730 [Nitrosomonas sp.]|nr:hypothetical protein [Nitrosomonas sp.]
MNLENWGNFSKKLNSKKTEPQSWFGFVASKDGISLAALYHEALFLQLRKRWHLQAHISEPV